MKDEELKGTPNPNKDGDKAPKTHGKGKYHGKGKGNGKPIPQKDYSNNLDWWNRYPALTKDVTNIAFNWIPGMRINLSDNLSGGADLDVPIASVLALHYLPTIGKNETDSDSYNAQIRELYIDMHRKYRGLSSYQKSDLGIALFCITDLFSTLAWAERIYGVLNYYNIQNRNVPYNLMEALHIGSTIWANLATFRYELNLRILRAQQLCLPKGLTMLESRIILNSAIFKDSENPRAALFLYEPTVYYQFDGTSISTGSAAISTLLSSKMTGTTAGNQAAFVMGGILNILDDQLNALLNDDDVTKMCSDLIAAYGPENVTTLIPIPEDYTVIPVHDDERKLQMHNATLCGEVTSRYMNTVINTTDANTYLTNYHPVIIYQHDNVIMNDLSSASYSGTYVNNSQVNEVDTPRVMKAKDCIFDVWRDSPTDADIMCGSRFTVLAKERYKVGTKYYQPLDSFGFDVVEDISIYTKMGNAYTRDDFLKQWYGSGDLADNEYSSITKFDWHPLIYVQDSTQVYIVGDLDNATIMTDNNLRQLHAVAVLSGAKLPMVGTTQVDTKQ